MAMRRRNRLLVGKPLAQLEPAAEGALPKAFTRALCHEEQG